MDMNIVSQVMDFAGQDEYSGIGTLIQREQDIADHIKELYPFFDVKGYLLEALNKLHRYSPAIGSPAEEMFHFLNDVIEVIHYGGRIYEHSCSYPLSKEELTGQLHLNFGTNKKPDMDLFRERYPSCHLLHEEELHGTFYIELCIDISDVDRFISDTMLIREYKGVGDKESNHLILRPELDT